MSNILRVIIILLLVAIIVIVVWVISKVQDFSRSLLGTKNLVKGLKNLSEKNAYTEANTPKSVRAMTSVYVPQITRDFPDFNLDEMKSKTEQVLFQYLDALDSDNEGRLKDVTEELQAKVASEIAMNVEKGIDSRYSNPHIHRTEISNYTKRNGKCIITFQTAIEYFFTQKKDGKTVAGNDSYKTQARYDIDCIYIQDRDVVDNTLEAGLGVTCPNCGAPLKGLGHKTCEYCGSPVVELSIKTWHFSDIRKV